MPAILDLGVVGLLAVALITVVRGDWMPRVLHEKIVSLHLAELERQSKEIARLQARNEEFVNLTLTGSLITHKVLELARMKSNEHNPPTGGG